MIMILLSLARNYKTNFKQLKYTIKTEQITTQQFSNGKDSR